MGTKKKENLLRYRLYGTLIGSCVVTIGKISGMTEKQIMRDFAVLCHSKKFSKCNTVVEVCEFLYERYNAPEIYKPNIILVTDKNNLYSPRVTIMVDDVIYPVDPEGICLGVLAANEYEIENVFD